MLIAINDDFDLKKIADSGQCFRVKDMGDGVFRFVTGSNVLYIRRVCDWAGYILAKKFKNQKNWELLNLGYLSNYYEFEHKEAHRAWSDAEVKLTYILN